MNVITASSKIRDLLALLEEFVALHEQLAGSLEERLSAIRRADVAVMAAVSKNEENLVRQIRQREGLRRQLLDRLGVEWGLGPRDGRKLTLSQIAERIEPPQRDRLVELGTEVKQAVAKVARLNRIADRISRQILAHTRWIFQAVRPRGDRPIGYAGDGTTVDVNEAKIFEAVG